MTWKGKIGFHSEDEEEVYEAYDIKYTVDAPSNITAVNYYSGGGPPFTGPLQKIQGYWGSDEWVTNVSYNSCEAVDDYWRESTNA